MGRPDPRRIGLIVLVVLVLVAAALLATRWMHPLEEPQALATRAFDASDVAVRRTLLQMRNRGGPLEDPQLSAKCERGHPDTWRVQQSPGFENFRPDSLGRAVQVTSRGNGAWMEYGEQGLRPDAPVRRAFASLDGPARDAWLASLHAGGYPTAWPPTADYVNSHAGWAVIESCVGGRYYVASRNRGTSTMDAFAGRVLDDAAARTRGTTP
jgi:hypothetical protein